MTVRARAADLAWGLACALAGAAFAAALYALNRRAFFSDDTQQVFAPMFLAIGQSLAHGHWPALTLQMLNGGALANEYQYGLYNPFSLLACWLISPMRDQAAAEAVFVGLHYVVLGSGAFAFARACGARRSWAALAAIAWLADNFISYWLAGSWITGLVGFAWMAWALACLMRAHASRWAWAGAAAMTYMVVTSGCYHVVVILALATAVIAIVGWRTAGLRAGLLPASAAALGVLLAAPAILPVLAMGQVAIRNGGLNTDGRLAMDLYGVLALSSPFHFGHFLGFARFGRIGVPFYFAGWFLLPLLPLIDWRKLGRPTPALATLAALAALLLVATQGPEQIFSIRFPIWYLPALHLALLTAFAVVASAAGLAAPSRPRVWGVVLIVWFGWLASLQVAPEMRGPALAAGLAILGLAAAGVWLEGRRSGAFAIAGVAGVAAFAFATHLMIPANPDQLDRGVPTAVTAISDLSAIPTTASVFLGDIDEAAIWKAPEIETGAMALVHGGANPFGYSPVGHRAFSYEFLLLLWGTPLPAAVPRVFQPSGHGALTWADLLRIDSVVIPRVDDRPARVAAAAGPAWRVAAVRPYTVTLARVRASPHGPGSVAWTSPGLVVAMAGPASAEHERLRVLARGGRGDTLVLDRLAVPGYRVTFNGAPLAFSMTRTPLMTLTLPDGQQTGDLTIAYAPPDWALGIAGSVLALVLLAAGVVVWPRLAPQADEGAGS